MNKVKLILTDCDGVLLRWSDRFETWVTNKGYVRIPNSDASYNLAHRYRREIMSKQYDIEFSEMKELVAEFNESKEMLTLEPWYDSVEYVRKLADKGFRFTVITSMSDAAEAKEYRWKNLQTVFGDVFADLVCLEVGSSKQHVLETWADSGLFWLEDHFKNAEAGHEVGLKAVLVDGDTNRKYHTDEFPRTSAENPWRDIYKMVLEEYNLED